MSEMPLYATAIQRNNANAKIKELEAEIERLRAVLSAIDSERKERIIEQYQAALRSVNAVAIERGDKYGVCDQIDNDGKPYPSQWLTDLLTVSDSPASALAASKSSEQKGQPIKVCIDAANYIDELKQSVYLIANNLGAATEGFHDQRDVDAINDSITQLFKLCDGTEKP